MKSAIDRATIYGLVRARAMEADRIQAAQARIKCYTLAASAADRAAAFRDVLRMIDETPDVEWSGDACIKATGKEADQ